MTARSEINSSIYVSTPTAHPAPVGSTSTKPIPLKVHHPRADRHRGAVPERPFATRQQSRRDGKCCALSCLNWKCANANEEKQALEDGKSDVGWGSQIRSYVLDSSRIKDLRTGYEVGNTKAVLDGDLDGFIEASLKQGV